MKDAASKALLISTSAMPFCAVLWFCMIAAGREGHRIAKLWGYVGDSAQACGFLFGLLTLASMLGFGITAAVYWWNRSPDPTNEGES